MCGIFGIIKKKGFSAKDLHSDVDLLFKLTEPRGREASGLTIFQGDKLTTYKRPFTASLLVKERLYKEYFRSQMKEDTNVAVIGHCRLVTDGSELLPQHNQPITLDLLSGVHNGVVNNHKAIKEKNKLMAKGKSDTEVLFKYIEKRMHEGASPDVALSDFYKELKGSASLAILFPKTKELRLTTNFGSLYFAQTNGEFIFASEEKILLDFYKKKNKEIKPKKLGPECSVIVNVSDLQLKENKLFCEKERKPFVEVQNTFSVNDLSPTPKNIKRCKRCILPVNYPFLKLDVNGVCNFCHKYKMQKFKGKEKLEILLDKYRSKDGGVDCLVGLSGGRDSSYGLHLLKEELGMNPIGFSYDWLLTSSKARHNIAKMSGALNVEVIYRCGDYETQAKNIRKNIQGFLKKPDLGMMTFVQAGDKEMYHYGRKIRKEKNIDLTVWCSGYQLEQREFFIGYCGINKTLINNPRLYDYGWMTKLQLAAFYSVRTLKNPHFWNRSVWDNFMAFWHCFVAKDDFLYLFNYYPWSEDEVERVLEEKYGWEADKQYGENQWRMDDFHTSFINYVYYTVGGFSEFDDFRSNQIREGLITRDEGLRLAEVDNKIKFESLKKFASLVGLNLEHTLKKVDAIPKLYL